MSCCCLSIALIVSSVKRNSSRVASKSGGGVEDPMY